MNVKEKRKYITEKCVRLVQSMLPNSNNGELTRKRLESLSDEEFKELMVKFSKGEDFLQLITPIGDDDNRLNIDNLQKVADDNNIELYHRIWIKDSDGGLELSNQKSIVLYLPIRVQQQLISKKASIPKDNNHLDAFTGQVTGKESKGARLSYPELNSLIAMGLIKFTEEAFHFRGGSEKGMRLLNESISKIGKANADMLKQYTGVVLSTKMLNNYLTAMQLKTTLLEKNKDNSSNE